MTTGHDHDDDWLEPLLRAASPPAPGDDAAFVDGVMHAVAAQVATTRTPLSPQQAMVRLRELQDAEARQRRWALAAGTAGTVLATMALAAGESWWGPLLAAGPAGLLAPIGALLVASVVLGLVVGDERVR